MFNVNKIREDFPALRQKKDGKPIIYADSACMALKPKMVIKALIEYYTKFTACAGRSPHKFSRETTKRYEESREKLAKFINTKDPAEIVWTRNTTEALNLGSGILKLDGKETIITTTESHNSNIVKWMFLKNARKIKLKILDFGGNSNFSENEFFIDIIEKCEPEKFLVSLGHISNVTAATIDAKSIAKIIHERGGLLMLDAAQSFPHVSLDVQDLGVDLMGVSMHKACGPSMGFLYGRYEILEKLNPLILGGETVSDVIIPDKFKLVPPPLRFEAGLQNFAGTIASGAAIDYLNSLGMQNIQEHDKKLSEALIKGLADFGDKLSFLGPKDPFKRIALAAIDLKSINSHEVAILLDDMNNIMLRSGYHCTHAFHHSLKLDQGTLRPSFYFYNTIDEIKIFVESLKQILEMLG